MKIVFFKSFFVCCSQIANWTPQPELDDEGAERIRAAGGHGGQFFDYFESNHKRHNFQFVHLDRYEI